MEACNRDFRAFVGWYINTHIRCVMEDPTEYKKCPRCSSYYNFISSLGKWECRYHPGIYSTEQVKGKAKGKTRDRGWSCCGRFRRTHEYTTVAQLTSAVEPPIVRIDGCKRCDCGNDLEDVYLEEIHDILPLFVSFDDMSGWDPIHETIKRTES